MRSPRQASDLVEVIYSTLDELDRWAEFLDRFSRATGGSLNTLHGQDLSKDRGQIAWAVNFDRAYQRAYAEYEWMGRQS